jgi:sterol desaturase/sphingolipid hydroxylase (fatty acid hydroxylase superfamily)
MDDMDDLPVRYSEMGGFPIDHGDEPIRLFKSNFLEFFTHITPQVVAIIWTPVIAWLLFRSVTGNNPAKSAFYLVDGFLIGIFLWTFAEYTLHRFVFHFHPRKSARMKRLVFLFHGIHHAQPQCKTRLVMPPAVSVPMAVVFYLLYYFLIGVWLKSPDWVNPVLAGFMTGYLIYDLAHYATHHFRMRWEPLRTLKRHHMRHHYKTPGQRFGVSSPLWDYVFGTLPG